MFKIVENPLADSDNPVELLKRPMAGLDAVNCADPQSYLAGFHVRSKLGGLVALGMQNIWCNASYTALQGQVEPGIAPSQLDWLRMKVHRGGEAVVIAPVTDDMHSVSAVGQCPGQVCRMLFHAAPASAGCCDQKRDGQGFLIIHADDGAGTAVAGKHQALSRFEPQGENAKGC